MYIYLARLYKHLEDEKVEFIQFAFRWINCLLMRELSTKKKSLECGILI